MPSVTKIKVTDLTAAEMSGMAGSFRNFQSDVLEDWVKIELTVKLDYRCGWFLCGLYGPPDNEYDHITSTDLTAGSYSHLWRPSSTAAPNLQFLTGQIGWLLPGGNIVKQISGIFFDSLKLSIDRGPKTSSMSCSITGYGRKKTDTPTPNTFSPGDNWSVLLDLSLATGGMLKLGNPKAGQTTAFDPTTVVASALQTALRAAGVYGAGNISVVAGVAPNTFVITAAGALVNTKMGLPTLDPVTGAMTGTASVAFVKDTVDGHKLRGGTAIVDFDRILPQNTKVFYDTLVNLIDPVTGHLQNSSKLLNNYSFDLELSGINNVHLVQDSDQTSYKDDSVQGTEDGRKEVITLEALFDAQSQVWLADFEAGNSSKYVGFISRGKVIPGTATNFLFRVVAHVIVQSSETFGEKENMSTNKAMFEISDDMDNGGIAMEIQITDDTPSYIVA